MDGCVTKMTTGKGEARRYFNEVVLPFKGDECLLWPYGADGRGYGTLKSGGRQQYVHRLVCAHSHGEAPTQAHEAAHVCGNRRCANPQHLVWKTPGENCADRLVHGTHPGGERNGSSKLTSVEVREILGLKGAASQAKIAAMYGISQSNVSYIHAGRAWTLVPR